MWRKRTKAKEYHLLGVYRLSQSIYDNNLFPQSGHGHEKRRDSYRKIIEKLHKRQGSEKSSKRNFEPPLPTGNRNCYKVLEKVGISTWSITGDIV